MNAEKVTAETEMVWCHEHNNWYPAAAHLKVGWGLDISGYPEVGAYVVLLPSKIAKAEEIIYCCGFLCPPNHGARYYPQVWCCGECGAEYHYQQTTPSNYTYFEPGDNRQREEAEARELAESCCLRGVN